MFNCEMIPAENVGVKHAKWDREDGYKSCRATVTTAISMSSRTNR